MGELLTFNVGCRRCECLVQIGKDTYMCAARCHMDDSDVVPIRDGKRTEDWNICNGENYVRTFNSRSESK